MNFQPASDKSAIALSMLCALHCLAAPLLVVFLPTAAALVLGDESFHWWMLLAVIPVSALALTMGCKKHKRYHLLAIGGLGLGLMLLAVFAGHDLLGESGEKILTLTGAAIIALGHYRNYRLCQQHDCCDCADT